MSWSRPPAARLALVALALVARPAAAPAHPLAPSLLEVRETGDGQAEVSWKTPLVRPRGAAPEPVLPSRCRPLGPQTRTVEDTGVRTRWTVACGPDGLVGERIGVEGLDVIGTLVRVALIDGRVVQGIVSAARPFLTVPAHPRRWDVLRDYGALGVRHILSGPDHLLFVFGLVLLATTWRRLLATVSAFTVGHSITLSLAALGLAELPSQPIEAAIALSVLVLAIELARDGGSPTLVRRYPWVMAAAFGLLHGLGFAAALREAGLPAGEIPLALLSFNLGIEAGQLLFVAGVLGVQEVLARIPLRTPAWTRRVPVYGMGSLAAFWWLERTAAFFH
jgi:hydrogenase/urease accessory protein HupE